MRAFIGFFVPDTLKRHIACIGKDIKGLPISCKAVELENAHVCLSFLGEIDEDEAGRIKTFLRSLSGRSCPRVRVGKLKVIPNDSRPRVVVLEIERCPELDKISSAIRNSVKGDMKPPHITICRIKNPENSSGLSQVIQKYEENDIEFDVSSVCLIKSTLGCSGPVYEVLEDVSLG